MLQGLQHCGAMQRLKREPTEEYDHQPRDQPGTYPGRR